MILVLIANSYRGYNLVDSELLNLVGANTYAGETPPLHLRDSCFDVARPPRQHVAVYWCIGTHAIENISNAIPSRFIQCCTQSNRDDTLYACRSCNRVAKIHGQDQNYICNVQQVDPGASKAETVNPLSSIQYVTSHQKPLRRLPTSSSAFYLELMYTGIRKIQEPPVLGMQGAI